MTKYYHEWGALLVCTLVCIMTGCCRKSKEDSLSVKPSPVNRVIMIVKGTGGAYEICLNSNGVVEASVSGGNKQVWTISADKSREIIKRAEKLLVARLADSYSLDPTYLEDYCLKIFANNREITVNLLHKGNVDIVPNDLMAVVNSMAGLSKW